jgi:hypothetical protein
MTGSTATEGPSYTLETKCGWKGVLKTAVSINSLWIRDDHHGTTKNSVALSRDSSSHTTSCSSISSATLNTTRSGQEGSAPSNDFSSMHNVPLYWMGGEPSKYDDNLEQQGVMSILKALTETERDEIIAFDMTVPIRHLRAEKVCFPFPCSQFEVRNSSCFVISDSFIQRATLQKLWHKLRKH